MAQAPPTKEALNTSFKSLISDYPEIQVIGLVTEDGFNIKSYAFKSLELASDKLAALASTTCALGNSEADSLQASPMKITSVESDSGYTLFCAASYLNVACVLTITANQKMSLATLRFAAKRLVKETAKIR